jgi:hypothetical protein
VSEEEREKMRKRLAVLAAVLSAIALVAGVAAAGIDFGQFVQRQLADQSGKLFGAARCRLRPLARSPRRRPRKTPATW